MKRRYTICDFGQGDYLGTDPYYDVDAESPVEAIRHYMAEKGLQGRIVRTIIDTDTRFLVRTTRGSYLYQLIPQEGGR